MNIEKISDELKISDDEKEYYHSLAMNLTFSGLDKNSAVTITSSVPGEGKSTCVFKTLLTLASDGNNVLLIDADVRKSKWLNRLNITKKLKGLVNYLSNKADYDAVIHEFNKNFSFIPIGEYAYNPSALLNNDLFAELINKTKHDFDFIIIDTPPMGAAVDASIVAKNCDACALVVAQGLIPFKVAKDNIKQLNKVNSNFLGVILNKVNMKNSVYRNYYESYYRKYYGKYY